MATTEKYYSLKRILEKRARYNVIFGERSNGKSFSVHELMLKNYFETGKQGAIIRRWEEDYKGKRGQETFAGISKAHEGLYISQMSKGKWDGIKYYSSAWYLYKIRINKKGDEEIIKDNIPFCYAFALTGVEHDKSSSYNDVTTVLFDEFLTRETYLPNEFISFQNCLSTIIRDRTDVTIFMLGNTVNKYCPYFNEMGLYNVPKMEQGTIDVYQYGDSAMTVAVEYTLSSEKRGHKKKSDDLYFAFSNPKLKMIKEGAWEIAIYPHLPFKYIKQNIKLYYFIVFNNEVLQCEIIKLNQTEDHKKCIFTYIHRKTTDLRYSKKDIIFQENYSPYNWVRRRIHKPTDMRGKYIWSFFLTDNVYYQDNEVGEIVRNYIEWAKADRII